MIGTRRTVAATLCAWLAAVALAAVPSGAAVGYKTTVFISEKFPAFHGKLHSPNQFCEADRPLKMFRVRNGPDRLLGKDRSENSGKWKVEVENLRSGAYYAKAPAYGSAALGIQCMADRSFTAVVE
jgi:hypothetical protein